MTIVATDLDRTLLPNGREPYDGSMEIFRTIVDHENIMLIYVTGRDLGLVKDALREFDPPLPKFVIAEVGTKVYSTKDGRFLEDHQWIRHIRDSTKGWNVHKFRERLLPIKDLRMQEAEKQNEFKLSYYIDCPDDAPALVGKVTEVITPVCKDATIVYSVNEMQNLGLLDILPRSATKLSALEHLRGKLGLDKDDIIYCGDSGNDTLPLTFGYRAILVRNAIPEVRDTVQRIMSEKGIRERLYIARGYKKLNGYYVSGIIEGLIHFNVTSPGYALQGE